MAIKLVDELKAMGNFPIAHAEGINLVKTDGTEDNLQNLFDNKELGGGGDSSVTLTQQEYEALSEEQKLNGLYYTYDTKRIYKNGVQYGASDAEGIGYNNAESGIQATTVQGAIDKVVEKVGGLISDTTSSTTSTWSSSKIADSLVDISRMKIYTNVKQLGLESECSTVDIFKAMPNNSLAIIGTFPTVSDEYCMLIDKPTSYDGLLTIVKFNHARFSIEYKLSGGTEKFPNRMYVGNFAGSEPTTIDWQELATMDKVVKDDRTAIVTLYSNSTGAFLKSDMNLTATKSGILKVSFNKKETGNTLNIHINNIHKYSYPNWWGVNLYETAYVPVNNGDEIRISTDVSDEGDWYRIVNVLII